MSAGREVADGSWHQIFADLGAALANAGLPPVGDLTILGIQIIGNQYRMDDLQLMSSAVYNRFGTSCSCKRIGVAPYLFHINHIYQQLFSSNNAGPVGTGRYVFACDGVGSEIYPKMCADGPTFGNTLYLSAATGEALDVTNANVWIENKASGDIFNWSAFADPAEIAAIDPALDAATYIAAVQAYEAAAGSTIADMKMSLSPSTTVTLNIGVAGAPVNLPLIDVYTLDQPQLTDGVMSAGPQTLDGGINMIQFTANVGGAHDLGACTNLIQNVPISEIPPYIPLYGASSLFPCCGDAANGFLSATQNNEIQVTAAALAMSGYSVWPAIAKIVIPPEMPQVMENLVVTVVASNGLAEDVEALTIITTNYPVTNYPPVIEDVDDQIFYIGQGPQTYQVNATDADSLTHGIDLGGNVVATPAGQPTNDMDQLIWAATLNGLPSYAYGPWTDQLIDQKTGLVSFTPDFEGAYEMVVSVRDQDGAEAVAAFVIHCIQSGTWLNHPPIMLGDWDHPMIGAAGQTLTLAFDGIEDPDGECLYYSCNIGTIGARAGIPVWEFSTMYPGTYMVEIVAYDTRGGYLVIPQEVIITPWWSN
jgi:hypothetical protein